MNTNQKINQKRKKNSAGIKSVADKCHAYLMKHVPMVLDCKGLVKVGSLATITVKDNFVSITHNIESLEVRVPLDEARTERMSRAIKSVTHLEYRIASK